MKYLSCSEPPGGPPLIPESISRRPKKNPSRRLIALLSVSLLYDNPYLFTGARES